MANHLIITDYSMQKSSQLGPSASLALGHRDQATRDSGHQGSCDEGCLHAEGFVQLLGSHAAEAEEEDARRKEHCLPKAGGLVVADSCGPAEQLVKPQFCAQESVEENCFAWFIPLSPFLKKHSPGLQELLTCHTITGAPAEQGANVRQVAGEMGGANWQGLASSGDAVLNTLREGEEQQALGSVVVAIAAMLLA